MKKAVVVTNASHVDYPFGSPILVVEACGGLVERGDSEGSSWVFDFDNETITFPWGGRRPMKQELLDHYGAAFGMEFSS